jgi:hypothetical protein
MDRKVNGAIGRNIFIFHAGALGDFIHTWPLGLALGRLCAQSRIIYVTQKQKGLLAEKALRLEFMDSEGGWHHLFGNPAGLPEVCRKRLASARMIFTFLARAGDAWMESARALAPEAQIVAMESGASPKIFESLRAWPAVQTAVGQMMASISRRGIGGGIGMAGGMESGPIAIHPGAGSPMKCWAAESYLRLIEELKRAGHRCRIFLGEVELERWSAEQVRRFRSAEETAEPATYVDLMVELAKCGGFVGNDSGPGQLAGIMGLPSVVLFGPSDAGLWKPLGPRVTVVRGEGMDSIGVAEVLEAVGAKGVAAGAGA